jgi:hypothetical protein
MKGLMNKGFLTTIVLVIVAELVGAYLGPSVFSQLNSAYTQLNGTSLASSNQPFVSIAGLGYLLALMLIPVVLLGFEAYATREENYVSRVIELVVFIFVAVILYTLLISPMNSLYNQVKGYNWASNYVSLIPLAPMFVILGLAVVIIIFAVELIKERI